MGAAKSGAGRNSRSLFVVGSRFYLAFQAARLDPPSFRCDKETLALTRRSSGAGETARGADSVSGDTNRSSGFAFPGESVVDGAATLPDACNPGWVRCENPHREP